MSFLEEHNPISAYQNGFRPKKSTARGIYQALVKVIDALNSAFDSVKHDILIHKLQNYGFRGIPLQLMKSFLTNRNQCVIGSDGSGGTISSQMQLIQRGVPQGSILGPLLYILYTNELPEIADHHTVQYADDTTLIFNLNNTSTSEVGIDTALRANCTVFIISVT
ncbi:hypothetical protein HUJ05_007580 [Dendroctonus ponderosae]|nr:hypothetical protein HUJ05_007580 [Dendroctonus ponderosae]